MLTRRERDNLDRQIDCKRLGLTVPEYNQFRRLSKKLRRVYLANTNAEISEGDYNAQAGMLEFKINELAKKHELYTFFQTDPRGSALYLDVTPENTNEQDYMYAVCIG